MATINGTNSNNTLRGSKLNDVIYGFGGNDTLYGLAGNDFLSGGTGNDLLDGGSGDDTLNGGAGTCTVYGGDGNDYYYVNFHYDVVGGEAETVLGGSDIVISSVDFTLATGYEHLNLSLGQALYGAGNAANNSIVGNGQDNALYGYDGNGIYG